MRVLFTFSINASIRAVSGINGINKPVNQINVNLTDNATTL
ncbi:Uncharacterised protein [Citrobacter youngae]|uniref:Uncharacterized protein n=1 Tax=Citrobacter youngae TaxID=133448 RepID=A0A9Q8E7K0_9ENTR|nr:hypothetical protein [Citrobacter youngae]SUX78802.1 Uncharacterised protein [Citrobacter youngae]